MKKNLATQPMLIEALGGHQSVPICQMQWSLLNSQPPWCPAYFSSQFYEKKRRLYASTLTHSTYLVLWHPEQTQSRGIGLNPQLIAPLSPFPLGTFFHGYKACPYVKDFKVLFMALPPTLHLFHLAPWVSCGTLSFSPPSAAVLVNLLLFSPSVLLGSRMT